MVAAEKRWTNIVSSSRFTKCATTTTIVITCIWDVSSGAEGYRYGRTAYSNGQIMMGPRYSIRNTVRHAICGPRSLTINVLWSRRPVECTDASFKLLTKLPSDPLVTRNWCTEYRVAFPSALYKSEQVAPASRSRYWGRVLMGLPVISQHKARPTSLLADL